MRKREKRSYRSCFTRHEEQNAEAENVCVKFALSRTNEIWEKEKNVRTEFVLLGTKNKPRKQKRLCKICIILYERNMRKEENVRTEFVLLGTKNKPRKQNRLCKIYHRIRRKIKDKIQIAISFDYPAF